MQVVISHAVEGFGVVMSIAVGVAIVARVLGSHMFQSRFRSARRRIMDHHHA